MAVNLPHPIPYQGSKRKLAPIISQFIPDSIGTWYEPFAGSAAMTIFAAHNRLANRYVIGDSLEPIVELLKTIVERPEFATNRYREIWCGQDNDNPGYFNEVRTRYNEDRDPIDLLYLICRCVKNAIRFNPSGAFTQSVDKRRLGMRPDKMDLQVFGVSQLLQGKTEFRCGDWLDTTSDAKRKDFVYMDPPYLGTSIGRDKRYHKQILQDALVDGLRTLCKRKLRFALSYDGRTGDKEYGPPLPESLGLSRLLLHAGTSSQATLSGRKAETIESLYLSPGLGESTDEIIREYKPIQGGLALS